MNNIVKKALSKTFFCGLKSKILSGINFISAICTIGGISVRDVIWIWGIAIGSILFFATTIILFCIFLNNISTIMNEKEEQIAYCDNIIKQKDDEIKIKNDEIAEYRDYCSFICDLGRVFSEINKIVRSKKINEKQFQETMLLFCTNLKESLETLIDDNSICSQRIYSVSIKVATEEADITDRKVLDDLILINTFRDIKSFQDNNRIEDIYNKTLHYASKNSAFATIINKILDNSSICYYLNNDVNVDNDYKTTSYDCYRHKKLPYQSELVVPIIPLNRTGESIKLLGFLCITSNLPNGFNFKEQEIRIILMISDGLYNLFSKWQKKQNKINNASSRQEKSL